LDYGKSWELITTGIDANHYTRAIRADPIRPGLLYAGTEWGMYISFNDGSSWDKFQLNLPIVSIRDLHVREQSLIAATHGRSFWMIDDLGPVREINAEISRQNHYLFTPKPAYRMAQSGSSRGANSKLYGQNHPNGVNFQFFIKDYEDNDAVKLEILELNGTLIRSFSNKAKESNKSLKLKPGGNSHLWDMRYEGFKEFAGMVLYASPNRGPKAVPGTYMARLIVNDTIVSTEFDIVKDPRVSNSQEDYQKQFDFLMKVRDKVSKAHQAILDIRELREDIRYLKDKIGDEYPQIMDALKNFEKEMTEVETSIHQTKNRSRQDALNFGIKVNNRLAFLMADQQRGDFPPTDAAEEVFTDQSKELDIYISQLNKLFTDKLVQINRMIKEAGISILMPAQSGRS
jgi:hypothetical protein